MNARSDIHPVTPPLRSPEFPRLEEAVLSGTFHPLLFTRPTVYSSYEHGELVRDVIALANVPAGGQRFIVFGVRKKPRSNVELLSLEETDHQAGVRCAALGRAYFTPALRLRYVRWSIGLASLGVLVIGDCDDRPYLASQDLLPIVRTGDGWVRSRNHGEVRRLGREDLEAIYTEKLTGPAFRGRVRVQFATEPPAEFVRLTTTELPELPSSEAAEKLQAMIVAKELLQRAANHNTYMGRLSHARVSSGDTPYQERGIETLRMELNNVAQAYRLSDDYYRYEQQAQRLNIAVTIESSDAIECPTLVLQLPVNVGVEIAPKIFSHPSLNAELAAENSGYPHVEVGPEVIRVSETLELQPGTTTAAFKQPLRILVTERACGYKIPVHYQLRGRNLRYPVTGKLYIVCPPNARAKRAKAG